MRRLPWLIALLLVPVLLGQAGNLAACGDKFLVVGRGTRFQRGARTTHPASVLIYAPSDCVPPGSACDAKFQSVLKQAGYPSATAASAQDLAGLLKKGGYDVVVADIADARAVERLAALGPSGPAVLPVLANATREQLDDARKTWGAALKSPATAASLLDAVDDAAKLRTASGGKSEGNR
ncbi:MAG TPA: hypothetical protein VGK70_15245 [Thermoanaerobaculia bacterium]